jgi:hypothetical protein
MLIFEKKTSILNSKTNNSLRYILVLKAALDMENTRSKLSNLVEVEV